MISLFPFVKSSASLKYKYQWLHGIWFRFKLGRGPLRAGISGPLGQLVRLMLKIPKRRKSRSEPIGPEMFAYALTKQYGTSYSWIYVMTHNWWIQHPVLDWSPRWQIYVTDFMIVTAKLEKTDALQF